MKFRLHLFYILALLFPASIVTGQHLYEIPTQTKTRWASFENPTTSPGSGGRENKKAKGHPSDLIQPGEKKTLLDIKGAGILSRIWLTVNERSPQMLRSLRIEMYWDDATAPAVSAPLGDFFGIGLGRKTAFENEFFSDPEGRSFNCYIPMPYKTAARVVVINDSSKPVNIYYDINLQILEKHDKPVYYFHAYWNRENKTKLGRDFVVLPEVKGKGRFLGMNAGIIADSIYETSWWGEGEVKIFMDGDTDYPTLIGTGTEDYIGSGWGQGQYANRYQGCPVADEKNKQWCFYRYHVPDPVYFNTQCKVTLQQMGGQMTPFVRRLKQKGAALQPVTVSGTTFHKLLDMNPPPDIMSASFPEGWTNYYREDDVSATAYFYLDKPVNELPAISALEVRTKGLLDTSK
jgi:hypothetical protein